MKISVRVKAGARQEKVEQVGKREFLLWVRQAPREGKANAAVIELLSEYLAVPKSTIAILKGQASKQKIIEVQGIGK